MAKKIQDAKIAHNVARIAPNKGFKVYFAGNYNTDAEECMLQCNANRLASQLLDRQAVNNWIRERDENGRAKGYLFIDSGAFTAHCKHQVLDVDEYIDYVNSIDDEIELFAQVDTIPGVYKRPKTPKELAEAPMYSWKNYLYMRDRVKSPDKLLPIFHQGEDFKWLENILNYVDENGKKIQYMGISPANDVSVKQKEVWIDKCFRVIKRSNNPEINTHAFGLMVLPILEKYPFTSADSTTWMRNSSMGMIMSKYGSIVLSDKSTHYPRHIQRLPKQAQKEIQKYVESHGYDIVELCENYRLRMKFNIEFLVEWAKNYEYKPHTSKRKSLF